MNKTEIDNLREELNELDKDRLVAMLICASIDYEGLINRYEQVMTVMADVVKWDNCPDAYKKIVTDLQKIDRAEGN